MTSLTAMVLASAGCGGGGSSPAPAPARSAGGTTFQGITLTGTLIWHSYTTYGFTGVQSWMANFDTGQVSEITPARILGAMNYHFSPDGTKVVVMGSDGHKGALAWDLFVASVTSSGLANITKITDASADLSRNEDPKFSSDGTKILFKRNNTSIASIDVGSFTVNGVDQMPPLTVLLTQPSGTSMPYYLGGSDTSFVFANDTANSIQLDAGGVVSTLYMMGTHDYYPIAIDATRFYFVSGGSNDWIYRGDTGAGAAVTAAFITSANKPQEFADPFPIAGDWLAYTSTVTGGAGSYDIWIGNFTTGQAFNLNAWIPGANRANSDLGPTFHGTISP
jgi:Tol biopolymer transport system component